MHRILFPLMLLVAISCQKWKPTVEQVAELCGPDLKGASILRFEEPDGDRLYTDETYDFSAHFQTSAGAWRELAVNSHGCLVPPSESGTLVARSLSRSWAFARVYDGTELPNYEAVKVTETQASGWELSCPTGGWIADDRLADVLRFKGSHSEVFDIQVNAQSADKTLQILSQKKIGLGLVDSMQDLNLRDLEVGVYELNLFVGFAGPEIPTRPVASCSLEIVRHEPAFSQDTWRDGETVRLHEKRAFSPTVAGDRLMVCRSPGYMREPGNSCEVAPACQDRNNFVETDGFSLDQAGPWTYVYFLKNRAGREGPLHCRRVYGSDRAPDFAMRWQESSWNEAGPILSSLPATIEANFEAQGHSLEPERPAPAFACKLEFVHNTTIIAGEGVRCLSGLCKGQSLEDFVPCSSPLRLTTARAFESEILLNSELRLTIRADDGAGQVSSRTQSLLMQHAQNFIWSTSRSLSNLGKDDVNGYWYKPDGGLLVRVETDKSERFFELSRFSGGAKSENWKEIPSFLTGDQSLLQSEVSITEKGTVLLSWTSRNQNLLNFRNEFARLDQGSWTPLTPKGWDPLEKRCSYFLAEDDETFLCFNNYFPTKPELLRLSLSKDPELIPLPELPSHCRRSLGRAPITWIRNARKELFAICHKEIAFRLIPGGSWESFPLPADLSLSTNTINFDEQDQPWFVMRKSKEAAIVAPTRLNAAIPFPSNMEGPVSTNESFGFDAQGQLRLGAYIWNPKESIWNLDEDLVTLLETSAVQVRAVQGERGSLFFETNRLTLLRSADGKDRLFPLKSLQWSQPYHDQFARPMTTGVKLGPQGELCFTERVQAVHLRCLLRKNWAQLGSPFTQLSSVPNIKKIVTSDKGEFLIAADDGIYERQGTIWAKVLPPVPESTFDIFIEGDSLWATLKDKIYRLKPSEKVWQLVSQTHENQGLLSRYPTRRAFTDHLGQVWILNRIQTSNRIGTRTLVKFSGDSRSLISFPESWEPLEIFPLDSEIIFLNEVSEAGQKSLKIHAMDIRTHDIRECDPAQWGLDFSIFSARNMGNLQSSFHEQAVIIYDKDDLSFGPMILDFRLKKQVPVHSLPASSTDLAGLGFVRLLVGNYLIINQEKNNPSSAVDNYSFRRIPPQGGQQFLYDTDDLRAMEDRSGLRVTLIAPILALGAGPTMWIKPTEGPLSVRASELLQFDLETLSKGLVWKSR